ncbi:hypothetical protein F0562_019300 [Nyssa sinensis]|uniref:BAG domain-containing protein n=1 Tax=Nyssa sinensis TaxID=561372 RepID=A0A5J4ZFL6_9ASTE|nr:hypothetical protein F0562_019300 [Nyssa sinensis]
MPFTHSYHPNFEAVPPQAKVDPARSLGSYESWPYGSNYGYSIPVGCHGCCNHCYFPGYYSFRPPCPHSLPPLPFYFHGSVPAFSESYPFHCTPLPHNSMEQPRYEYDNNGFRDHHCCGSPNHLHNWREDTNVKTQEQDPDVEKKSSNSLAPVEFKNYPYPVVWFPPAHMKNKELRKPIESNLKERDEYPRDTNASGSLKSSEQEPSVWNGWFPVDMNSLGSLKHDGDGKGTQNNQNENKSLFPFPIFWMPCKPEEVERNYQREATTGRKSVEESPSNFWITPVTLPGSGDKINQPIASEENPSSGSRMMEKSADREMIPMKQLEQHEDKRTTSDDAKGKARSIPVKPTEDNGEKKPFENSTKRRSSSPTKPSKLPPVCLRVDTRPRRKNCNGSSRSPSPSQKISLDFSDSSESSTSSREKGNTQQELQCSNSMPNKTKEVDPNRRDKKVIEVLEGITGRDKNEDCKAKTQNQFPVNLPVDSHEEVSISKTTSEVGIGYGVSKVKEDKGARDAEGQKSGEGIESKCATVKGQSGNSESEIGEHKGVSKVKDEKFEEVAKEERKSMSEAEAAVIIQSSFRGFEVRKGEPLKKLKQIAQIQEQVTGVRSRIQALESSSDIQSDDKQRVVIGETVMSLLLKLDTIQGLHPSVRDVRKSIAKELVSLQEKLDSLSVKKSEVSTANPMENLSIGHQR